MGTDRVALVTGANKGLGLEVARQLARAGLTVLLGSRDRGRGVQAAAALERDGLSAHVVEVDVTDDETLRAIAGYVGRTYGRLDVLVNNAGAIVETPPADLGPEQLRAVLEVNVVGVVAAIHALLPLLRDSSGARIVNVSSTTASLALTSAGTDFGGNAAERIAYSTSKTALNMLTLQYARAFAQDEHLRHIKINAATPGYVATDLNGHTGTRTVEEGARAIVELATIGDAGPTGGFFNDQGRVAW